jgi:hypothetical protein
MINARFRKESDVRSFFLSLWFLCPCWVSSLAYRNLLEVKGFVDDDAYGNNYLQALFHVWGLS